MSRLKLLIIDDERSARELIKSLLQDNQQINIVAEAGTVDEGLIMVLKHRPDILLLDIQMPKKDGFALLEKLSEHEFKPEIIFITAYDQYAIRAIKSSAVDYLLKPVKKEDLTFAISKASERVRENSPEKQYSKLISHLKDRKRIKLKNRTGFSMVDVDDIIYCEADSNYSVLHLDTEKTLTVSLNLGKVEEMLPEGKFCRISRSAIINLSFLMEVDRKSMTCQLVNSSSHTLSISKKQLKVLEDLCDSVFNIDSF